ncbi:mismatch-specific thymine-dna glycosylate [Diplodia corticola]|uniref:Mismatch-specific thymine-dna glycosylate n=1 Tax=Diplodia corticola TaxID=236234 RepID=A0A1J9S5H3_9PEZI|nr:mismatch-specific thymine-dna glycosylate [Diplodia corticola]OJD35767.1 mismatch-specific thymine-dna glycosylate [Diplodia corticola]
MARTRASKARPTDQLASTNGASSEPTPPCDDTRSELDTTKHERRDITRPASTFNGRLQQFHYPDDGATSPGETASPQATSSSRPGLKRARTSPGLTTRPDDAATQSPAKKRRVSSKYAPPSHYAHLKPLTDILEPHLICVFVGFNPGVRTATAGHAYAHPSNLFWKLLHSSGLTDRLCRPEEDVDLPRLYSMGNTNLVSRPSKNEAELSKQEQAAGTPILEAKIREYEPEAVCIVGKGIWESIWRWRYGRNPSKAEFKYGWQDERENIGRPKPGSVADDKGADVWQGARVYVATATSGLAASTTPAEKEAIWRPFGQWVKERREQRSTTSSSS